ncbi:MAG: chromosome segregation protein SMC [Thermodesulfobacteriota bacterium]
MRLKQLELSGFKSFPESSVIHFPPGIFSIVGPNGCGKSNIIDALKWVMGEQSALQLRGKSMEDVIFAGSDGKSPVNMAEVSLTLVNDNGSAPEELKHLSEIMITRRMYRSGERAYFINRQPCRLKDIYNIFMGSGMGARSYSIIQQGNIGAITEATPEERRTFIEEAAGVTRYKTRKEETLRKIKATDQDLLRVKDIMAEVQQRMNSLNRQAKTAQRYKDYREAIKVLDILISLNAYNEYGRKISETDALLQSLRDIDNTHAAEIGKLDAAIEAIKHEKDIKDREIADLKEKRYECQRTIDKAEKDLDYFRQDRDRIETDTFRLKEEEKIISEKNARMTSEIAEVEAADARVRESNQQIRAALEERQEASQQILQEVTALKKILETRKSDLMRLTADEAKYHNICQHVSESKESLLKRKQEIRTDRITAARNTTRLKHDQERIKTEIETVVQQIAEMNEQISVTGNRLDEKHKALSNQVKLVQSTDMEKNRIRSKYTEIKKLDENFEWYKDGVKSILQQAADEKTADGCSPVMGVIADIVKPEPGFETATEAALGESLQYILVDSQQTGVQWIDGLKANHSGRSGFIPVAEFNELTGAAPEPVSSTSPDLLINHITVSQEYKPLITTLIGRVFVTPDLHEALKLWHQPNGSTRKTVVTREGDLVSPLGIIVGGSKDRMDGILSKKQEIKDLARQIEDLAMKLDQARQTQSAIEKDVRELEEDLQQLKNSRNQAVARQMELEKESYRISTDLDAAVQRLEILELEEQHLDGEESDLDDEINKVRQTLASIQQQMQETETLIKQSHEAVNRAATQYEEFNQATMELRLKLSASQAELESNRKTMERLRSFQVEAVQRRDQIASEIASKQAKMETVTASIGQCEQQLAAGYGNLESLEGKLSEHESMYTTISERISETDRKFADIRSQREKNAENIRFLDREQLDRAVKQEGLVHKLEDLYHAAFATIRQEYEQRLSETDKTIPDMENELTTLREKLARIGDVNLGAITEYEEHKNRLEFLTSQHDDLVAAIEDLHQVIKKINRVSQQLFLDTFNAINQKMNEVFPRLFDGGTAELVLADPNQPLESGVELMIHLPGKKLTRLSLLSGGEKALSAIAFIFSIFLLKPTSFCLMDEIDAPLDEANVYRFNELLKIIGEKSQIIMITHNKKTMEFADQLLGVTMEKKGISKIVSVSLSNGNGQKHQQAMLN